MAFEDGDVVGSPTIHGQGYRFRLAPSAGAAIMHDTIADVHRGEGNLMFER